MIKNFTNKRKIKNKEFMTPKQRTAVIALLRLMYNQDEILIHNKEIQNDFLLVLEGILDDEIVLHTYTNTKPEEK